MVIALDGSACSGKSTLAFMLAKQLGFYALSSGNIFRALTYVVLKNNIDVIDAKILNKFLKSLQIDVLFENNLQKVIINGQDTTKYLTIKEVNENVSLLSQLPYIRKIVLKIQRKFAKKYNLVVEGRDIGTVVFPRAKHKFFITANLDERVSRRYASLKKQTPNITLEEVKKNLQQRDYNDSHRKSSPTKQAKNSILIDTTHDSVQQSIDKMMLVINR